jgi:hypothetical protein
MSALLEAEAEGLGLADEAEDGDGVVGVGAVAGGGALGRVDEAVGFVEAYGLGAEPGGGGDAADGEHGGAPFVGRVSSVGLTLP